MRSAKSNSRTPSVCLRQPPPSMREARKYFGFTSWFLRVFRRVAGDVPLPLPAKRALHGSRKASASCLRKTGRRGRRPLPCAYGALHSSASTIGGGGPRQRWKEFAGYILQIAKVIGVFPGGESYHEEDRQTVMKPISSAVFTKGTAFPLRQK